MHENLLIVCLNAFFAVMLLLSLLAVTIRALTWLFPVKAPPPAEPEVIDQAVVAAIAATAAAMVPGGRVTHVRETPR